MSEDIRKICELTGAKLESIDCKMSGLPKESIITGGYPGGGNYNLKIFNPDPSKISEYVIEIKLTGAELSLPGPNPLGKSYLGVNSESKIIRDESGVLTEEQERAIKELGYEIL
jgi:hypothetical protein